jgi:HK97 family phage prohead protease
MRAHAREFTQREAPIVEVQERQRSAIVAISSEHPDRFDSVISQRGLRYGQGLPVLVGHDSSELPVARATRIWLGRGEDGVATTFARLQFPPAGEIGAADEAYSSLRTGLADSLSIGFWVDEASQRSDGLLQIDQAELAEISLVAVPANSRARVVEVNRAPALETRLISSRPASGPRVIHSPTMIARSETAGLDKVTFADFAVLALPREQRDDRDLGPAEEWHQELVRMAGKAPAKGVLAPIGLLFTNASDLARRALTPLTTEELMRNLLDYYVAAMRNEAFFGPLGVSMLSPAEPQVRIPSVATPGAASTWIGKDTAATPTAIPTFTDVTGVPHTLSTDRIVPRSLLLYTSGQAENIIRQDMAGAHIAAMCQAYLFGDPVADANSPKGLLKTLAVAATPAAPLVMGRADLLAFIQPVEGTPLIDNATLRWFFPQKFWRQLQLTPLFPDAVRKTDDCVLAADASDDGPNMLGYGYVSSRYLRSTQGTGHDCDLIFGDFSSTYWTSWQAANVMANPYSADPQGFRAGGIELLILSDHDLLIRDAARFVFTNKATIGSPLSTMAAGNGGAARPR